MKRTGNPEHRSPVMLLAVAALLAAGGSARADQNYSQQVFFENSFSPASYFYSIGKASQPSTLQLIGGKVPVETSSFVSGPNALELAWKSAPEGGWSAELRLEQWRNRTIEFPGANLWLWLRAPDGIRAQDLPKLALRDVARNFTWPLDIGTYASDLAPGAWTRVRI
ncbi:MAG TPA: hypothetical protein VKT75_19675, partial [Acidobacteriaceae bacterium]|nr:hypothetical protein [Acidobacteriaceae bacterium]